jgi:hypothetical protein
MVGVVGSSPIAPTKYFGSKLMTGALLRPFLRVRSFLLLTGILARFER